MTRRLGYSALVVAGIAALAAGYIQATGPFPDPFPTTVLSGNVVLTKALLVVSTVLGFYGVYVIVLRVLAARFTKRRAHDVRNVLRLLLGGTALISVLGVITEQWVGVLLSLGVVGFAITFALQQPLLSLLGWVYIMLKRPYAVGDRVKIGDSKGDVIEVDFLVTTLWEVNGDLVSTHQPSGRVVTVPNSVVLSSQVVNYTTLVDHVWNELSIQVAFETDLRFARQTMIDVADDYLGDAMAREIADYRERLSETAVELEVQDGPTVNVVQTESWVELRLRYLVHPRGARTRNVLYERILERFNAAPERVKFPVSRNR
ncbi:mechanosensitive ion channel protein MscS [Salinigranum rubrum]|uniref:Mechanosensitive ion channel protein MscS n=1 Tax=Salinigranum rubrum TaxID=755307 RepID=A0A2I8VJC4_9EURY|nr:mechanosensitive ion channel domain-containing protein [Salinigranum rubrum]AUV82015.1 mechanosensitive ion channel protein MscS [Salinigranum rubrum]